MGEIRKSDDLLHHRKPSSSDIPTTLPRSPSLTSIEDLRQELLSLQVEIEHIKRVLKAHGIAIE